MRQDIQGAVIVGGRLHAAHRETSVAEVKAVSSTGRVKKKVGLGVSERLLCDAGRPSGGEPASAMAHAVSMQS
jgi:hypothetical protein